MKAVIVLLSVILLVVGLGLYSYQRELNRKANERCDKAHSEFQFALAASDWPFTTPQLEKELKACGGLTPTETVTLKQRREELNKSAQEAICEDDLRRYGADSTPAKQHCPGTQIGKKAGF
jgi:hypothetical protein